MVWAWVKVEFEDFDWDEAKQSSNLKKHEIDFDDAIGIFERPVLRRRSDRGSETRYLAVGTFESRVVAVAYTERGEVCRVISARKARPNERRAYRQAEAQSAAEG